MAVQSIAGYAVPGSNLPVADKKYFYHTKPSLSHHIVAQFSAGVNPCPAKRAADSIAEKKWEQREGMA